MGQISVSVSGSLVPKSGTKTFSRSVAPDDIDGKKQAYSDLRSFVDECEKELLEPA